MRGESSRVRGKRGLERVTIESWRATTRVSKSLLLGGNGVFLNSIRK